MKKFISFLFVLALILIGGYYLYKWIIDDPGDDDGSTTEGVFNPKSETFTVNGVSFTMMPVEGGTFTMGATAEQGGDAAENEFPNHKVKLSSFSLGQTEVTQELWKAVMGTNPPGVHSSVIELYKTYPVHHVSWDDCVRFVTKLRHLTGRPFRLPTEAEWEYAARGGRKSKGYGNMSKCFKYAGSDNISEVACYSQFPSYQTQNRLAAVASKAPNELGLYDMSGNIWEFCQDFYGTYTEEDQRNPQGPPTGTNHVIRGGCHRDPAKNCRVTSRSQSKNASDVIGMRVAL